MENINELHDRRSKYQIIRKTIKDYEEENCGCYGFCNVVFKRSLGFFTKEDYPELFKQKPKSNYKYIYGNKRHYRFWWSPHNNKRRIQAVDSAIKLVDEKISNYDCTSFTTRKHTCIKR